MTTFTIDITNHDQKSEKELVFLKPQQPLDYQIHAWQVPTGPAGITWPVNYEALLETAVTAKGEWPGSTILAGRLAMTPGTQLQPLDPAAPTPALELPTRATLAPQPPGTRNPANPYPPLDRNWYVDVRPLPSMPKMDAPLTVSYEHQPSFSLTPANPPPVEPGAATATDTPPPGSDAH